MTDQQHHLTDEELLRTIDGELPSRREASAAAHLERCAACRDRRAAMARAGGAFDAIYCGEPPADGQYTDPARNRLRTQLLETGGAASTPWRRPAYEVALATIAAAAALVLLVRVLQPAHPAARLGNIAVAGHGALPVATLTPGATWNVSVGELCTGTAHEQRPIPIAIRESVVRAYRMEHLAPDAYELDYLITPELGGAPDARNLWPQRYGSAVWNALVKDDLERLLPDLVCRGEVDLETAQRDIARDWIAAYKKHFRTESPLKRRAARSAGDAAEEPDDLTYPVWRAANAPALKLISFTTHR